MANTVVIFMSYYNMLFVVQLLSSVQLLCDPMDCSLPGSSVHGVF